MIGINVRTDKKGGARFADMIVNGLKTLETRNTRSLDPWIGKRVAIVRTGEGKAKAIGSVIIGKPFFIPASEFNDYFFKHFVMTGSDYDVKSALDGKWCYPVKHPVKWAKERDVKHGIIARQVI